MRQFDSCIYLAVEDAAAAEVLLQRKYHRAHLGKPSYKDRGVTEAEVRVFDPVGVQPYCRSLIDTMVPTVLGSAFQLFSFG